MPFKDISYLELWWRFCSAERIHLCILVEGIKWNNSVRNCEIIFSFGPVVEELSFKDISYLVLWRPFCSAERNHLCNFSRGYLEEKFCEIIFNSDQWFRSRCQLNDCLSGALAALMFSGVEPFMQF